MAPQSDAATQAVDDCSMTATRRSSTSSPQRPTYSELVKVLRALVFERIASKLKPAGERYPRVQRDVFCSSVPTLKKRPQRRFETPASKSTYEFKGNRLQLQKTWCGKCFRPYTLSPQQPVNRRGFVGIENPYAHEPQTKPGGIVAESPTNDSELDVCHLDIYDALIRRSLARQRFQLPSSSKLSPSPVHRMPLRSDSCSLSTGPSGDYQSAKETLSSVSNASSVTLTTQREIVLAGNAELGDSGPCMPVLLDSSHPEYPSHPGNALGTDVSISKQTSSEESSDSLVLEHILAVNKMSYDDRDIQLTEPTIEEYEVDLRSPLRQASQRAGIKEAIRMKQVAVARSKSSSKDNLKAERYAEIAVKIAERERVFTTQLEPAARSGTVHVTAHETTAGDLSKDSSGKQAASKLPLPRSKAVSQPASPSPSSSATRRVATSDRKPKIRFQTCCSANRSATDTDSSSLSLSFVRRTPPTNVAPVDRTTHLVTPSRKAVANATASSSNSSPSPKLKLRAASVDGRKQPPSVTVSKLPQSPSHTGKRRRGPERAASSAQQAKGKASFKWKQAAHRGLASRASNSSPSARQTGDAAESKHPKPPDAASSCGPKHMKPSPPPRRISKENISSEGVVVLPAYSCASTSLKSSDSSAEVFRENFEQNTVQRSSVSRNEKVPLQSSVRNVNSTELFVATKETAKIPHTQSAHDPSEWEQQIAADAASHPELVTDTRSLKSILNPATSSSSHTTIEAFNVVAAAQAHTNGSPPPPDDLSAPPVGTLLLQRDSACAVPVESCAPAPPERPPTFPRRALPPRSLPDSPRSVGAGDEREGRSSPPMRTANGAASGGGENLDVAPCSPEINSPPTPAAPTLQFDSAEAGDQTHVKLGDSALQVLRIVDSHLTRDSFSHNISPETLNDALFELASTWFLVSSELTSSERGVRFYLSAVSEFSSNLIKFVVNMTDANGNTALHYAVSHANFDVVSALLDTGVALVDQRNFAGYSPIMLTALVSPGAVAELDVVQRLLDLGDVNQVAPRNGQTALMLASSQGSLAVAELLISAGADVNSQDSDGSTALMCAAEHGHGRLVRRLLEIPLCNSAVADLDGSTALTIAIENRHHVIIQLLEARLKAQQSTDFEVR